MSAKRVKHTHFASSDGLQWIQGTDAMVALSASFLEAKRNCTQSAQAFNPRGKFQSIARASDLVSTQSRGLLRDRETTLAARPTTAIDDRSGIAGHLVRAFGDDGDDGLGELRERLRDG